MKIAHKWARKSNKKLRAQLPMFAAKQAKKSREDAAHTKRHSGGG